MMMMIQAGSGCKGVAIAHRSAALAGAGDELGRVDLLEGLAQQRLPEQLRACTGAHCDGMGHQHQG